ncbi:Na(+)-translocating NADH-quinone reductase subunit F [bacterium BMS3Abin14]|nr:Na(+)-translocating NADH-quinone reductase subunit F [bacterium BMS3Abin14]
MSGTVRIHIEGIGSMDVPTDLNLREALRREGIFLDGTCADEGTCGRCVVRILEGDAGSPSASERGILGDEALGRGDRLACRIRPTGPLKLTIDPERILEVDRTGRWKGTWGSPLWDPARFPLSFTGWGIAVDLGTTSVASALFCLDTGRPMDILASSNPQIPWGDEILSRLQAASGDPEQALKLREVLLAAVAGQIQSLCSRNGLFTGRISRIVMVGNSAMHHLALGLPVAPLLTPPFSPGYRDEMILGPAEFPLGIGLNHAAEIIFPALVDGFVGSDASAGILAVRSSRVLTGALLDIGTNSEAVVWKGDRIFAGSAAAGPAFEGGHIQCGMRAEEGAVFQVKITGDALITEVVGGGAPRGMCGTGIVDLVAGMLDRGIIENSGLVRADVHPSQSGKTMMLDPAGRVFFEPRDVETVQKTKAAIAATLETLMKRADVSHDRLEEIYLAGAFGARLNLHNAIRIGLLPSRPELSFVLAGNTALIGASYVLLSREAQEEIDGLAAAVQHVSIAQDPGFEDSFIDHLFF